MSGSRAPSDLGDIVAESSVIVCCGSGGVGKTTCAAALGVAGALGGRRTCVITVDPARRLADALGVGELANTPRSVRGEWPGTLDAMALDAAATFDELIVRYAADTDQAERILGNRLYQNLASSLSGTQEYMATEKLHELAESGRYDLVVVDTPPTRNALDFLSAPERLAGFLDNRVFRLLIAPARTGLRVAGFAGDLLLRNLGRVAGTAIVEDTVGFFRAFSGMEEGFRARAATVAELLGSSETAYVLVASPRAEALREAAFFTEELRRRSLVVAASICNRAQPTFGSPIAFDAADGTPHDPAWEALVQNLGELSAIASEEAARIAELADLVGPAPVTVVPLAPGDIHDLEAITALARQLLSGTVR